MTDHRDWEYINGKAVRRGSPEHEALLAGLEETSSRTRPYVIDRWVDARVNLPPQECKSPLRSTILSEAEALVYGDRGKAYGHPSDDYGRTAALMTAIFRHKLKDGESITAQDAILAMICVKVSREVNLPGVDNRRDLAGYALCLDRVETGL